MGEAEVKVGKIQEPTSLAAIETLGGTEEGKVLVVSEDLDGEWRAM